MATTVTPFRNTRGTGDFVTDARLKGWRKGIYYLAVQGNLTLTAITSLMRGEEVSDPEFNWWVKGFPTRIATITGVYTNSTLATAYTTAQSSGAIVYVKMSEAHAKEFVVGNTACFRKITDLTLDCVGRVVTVLINGTSSYVAVKLVEADDNSSTSTLATANRLMIVGSAHPEGDTRPTAVSYNEVKVTNYTQIFRSALSITRTARKTKLRTVDSYNEAKREALAIHTMDMERAWMFGQKYEGSESGKVLHMTQGIIPFIRENASENIFDYVTDTGSTLWKGKAWTEGGLDWFEAKLKDYAKWSTNKKLAICGNGALLALNQLTRAKGEYAITAGESKFGTDVRTLITPFMQLDFMTHPLFNISDVDQGNMLIIEPGTLRRNYIDDTFFKPDETTRKGGGSGVDGTEEEFLTEAGLEYSNPELYAYFTGLGQANTVVGV